MWNGTENCIDRDRGNMDIYIFKNVQPEDNENLRLAFEQANSGDSEIETVKTTKSRSEINHQNYLRRKEKQSEKSENVTIQTEKEKEEREEKEKEVSPLDSPLPFPPLTPYSYPPFNPPFPEKEKGERGEKEKESGDVAGATLSPASTGGNRGKLWNYGPVGNVMISQEEYDKLIERFGANKTDDLIENLSLYMGQNQKNAKKYSNHYLTLLNWGKRDEEKQSAKPAQPKKESWSEIAERLAKE